MSPQIALAASATNVAEIDTMLTNLWAAEVSRRVRGACARMAAERQAVATGSAREAARVAVCLLANSRRCPVCDGAGTLLNAETGRELACPHCFGRRRVALPAYSARRARIASALHRLPRLPASDRPPPVDTREIPF